MTYDVYGRQGLEAGLDVAVYTGGMSRDQQRAEWAEFQRRSAEQGRGGGPSGAGHSGGLGDRIASRGIYVIKVHTDSNSPSCVLARSDRPGRSSHVQCTPVQLRCAESPRAIVRGHQLK